MKLDKRSSYLTMFSCPFGRYRYTRLPFEAAQARALFQKKTDEIFSSMPILFDIAGNILIASFDE